MRDTRHQTSKRRKLFRFDQRRLSLLQMVQRCFGGIAGAAYLPFVAFPLGNFFGRDVDADDITGGPALRMPIGDPEPFLGLIGALPATSIPVTGLPVSMIERTIASTEDASAGTQSRTVRPR
jgi:hypothetical protein